MSSFFLSASTTVKAKQWHHSPIYLHHPTSSNCQSSLTDCVCSAAVLQHLCRRLPEAGGGLSGRWWTQQQLLWREGQTRRVQELWLWALPSVELRCLGRGEGTFRDENTHFSHTHESYCVLTGLLCFILVICFCFVLSVSLFVPFFRLSFLSLNKLLKDLDTQSSHHYYFIFHQYYLCATLSAPSLVVEEGGLAWWFVKGPTARGWTTTTAMSWTSRSTWSNAVCSPAQALPPGTADHGSRYDSTNSFSSST